jgi:hypothetical protein
LDGPAQHTRSASRSADPLSTNGAVSDNHPSSSATIYSTPICPTPGLEGDHIKSVPYALAIGSLMYAMVATRPDIAYVVGIVSRFMHNPSRPHWNTVKDIFRYLVGTQDYNIKFGPNVPLGPVGFIDSDYAGCLDTRKSTSGYFFRFGTGGISWRSKLQDCTTTSTTEAEYVATSDVAKEALWLGRLARTFRQYNSKWILTVFNDSQGVVALAKNLVHHNASKHIEVRYHFVRDCATKEMLSLEKISTTNNVADAMTKSLSTDQFWSLRNRMGVELISG